MARRQHVTLTVFLVLFAILTVSYLFSGSNTQVGRMPPVPPPSAAGKETPRDSKPDFTVDLNGIPAGILEGDSIAPKLENATLKAELGRATWKFLHTMVSKYPEKPTPEDRTALKTFVQLFGRLYPCGDCARHFRQLMTKYPPQTSSRNAAAAWLCFAHNQVNERLGKPIFDCNNIGDFYDCGCGDDKKKKKGGEKDKKEEKPL